MAAMEKRRIGTLEVSMVGVGCNTFGWPVLPNTLDAAGTADVVHAALTAGINFFDTAESYGESEVLLGQALRGRREEAVIATKFSKAHPEAMRASLDASLLRLGTDYIDLWQLHRPDPAVPLADTLGVIGDAIREGKVREGGCSNFSVAQLVEADTTSAILAPVSRPTRPAGAIGGQAVPAAFVSVQNELSILNQGASDVVAWCEQRGTAFLPYFPLAAGLLTGKYRRGRMEGLDTRLTSGPLTGRMTQAELDRVEALAGFAESRGHTLLELAFGWLLASPAVASVIAGARSVAQVAANAEATRWRLTAADVAEVSQIARA
ncbi:MAG: aldo/keto reductase [Vicinamibacterales bacterium]